MPILLRGQTTSIPKDGVVAPWQTARNLWEVWYQGSMLAASNTPAPSGWYVAPDPNVTDYYLITVPLSAPSSSGNAYQFRYGGMAAGSDRRPSYPTATPTLGRVASGHFDVSDAQFITGGLAPGRSFPVVSWLEDQAIIGGLASGLHIPGGQMAQDQTISGGLPSALVVPSDTLALAGGSGAVGSIVGGGIRSTVIGAGFLGNGAPQNIVGIQPGAESVTYGSAGSMTGAGQPAPYSGTNNFLYHKQIMVDGTPLVGNKLARMRNDNNLTWGVSAPAGMQPIANVEVYTNLPNVHSGGGINVFLDYCALETCLNNSTPGPYESGANAIWLGNGGLCAIYKQRDSVGDAWNYWYRVNNMGGYTDGTPQPTISSGVMGNWSARQAISVPTTDWLQICRGQDHIVALYNTGTLQINQQPRRVQRHRHLRLHAHSGQSVRDLRPRRRLHDLERSGCYRQWRPSRMGGLCWTGGEWVAVYTRSRDQVCVVKRSRSLEDWSSADETDTEVYRPEESAQIPARRLHCYGLAYDERNSIQGYWAPYEDTPTIYTTLTTCSAATPRASLMGNISA